MNTENLINGFPASDYQIAMREFTKNDSGHAIVKATAGSAKTTSSEWCMSFIPRSSVLYIAFNRDIVSAFKKRQNGRLSNVKAVTTHSLGLENLRRAKPDLIVDSDGKKVWKIANALLVNDGNKKTAAVQSALVELLRMAKLTLTPSENIQALDRMCQQFGYEFDSILDDDDIQNTYSLLVKALELDKKLFWDTGECDFGDMLYLPAIGEVKIQPYDFVFFDEAQDAAKAQVELLLGSLGKSGRAICVGDDYQAINLWAGAMPDSMTHLKNALQAKELPLSISYRCPKNIVLEAKKLCPVIEAFDKAKDGEVEHIETRELEGHVRPEKDIILCRLNAPLVTKALDFILSGRKASVRGRDIGKNLSSLAKKIANGTNTILDFHKSLDTWENNEIIRLINRRASEQRLDSVRDRADVLRQIGSRVQTPSQVATELEHIFKDQPEGIQLSSCHRSKGLEFENVYILQPELMPFKAKTPEEKIQERNVKFVAVTRSKNGLYYLDGETKATAKISSKTLTEKHEDDSLIEMINDLKSLIGQARKICLDSKIPKSNKAIIQKSDKLVNILNKAFELCGNINN